jgi:ubiquinone/menaquinone biosynthesis C-methylase UbiE
MAMKKRIINKLKKKLFPVVIDKEAEEVGFWRREILRYEDWFDGKIELYGHAEPTQNEKIILINKKISAMLTWFNVHQKVKYAKDLQLDANIFAGKNVLDIGSGPFPNSLVFKNAKVYNLDPLLSKYMDAGFPIHIYEDRAKFVKGYSEDMPFEDSFFDAIISVNAIDHVNDLEKTANEVKRVMKDDALFRMHVHYHKPSIPEPIEITDEIFMKTFGFIKGLKKISESKSKMGHDLTNLDESYVVWSNF